MHKLAIVIPFYKLTFFEVALNSIANQTNKNFKVYVADDGSTENVKPLIDQFKSKIELEYVRFDTNLGKTDLVAHWNRSVKLADEEWIWLFSDDDVMSEGCVQAFYDALNKTGSQHDIYRFNIEMINNSGKVILVKDTHPRLETGYDFLLRRLHSKSLSAAVEYIFKKEVFEKNNGFVNFPLAFCSDDASWITFTNNKPIYTIPGSKVYWRSSAINISSKSGLQKQKTEALLAYCLWVKNKFGDNILNDLEIWFFETLRYIYGKLTLIEKYQTAKTLSVIFNRSRLLYLKKLFFYVGI
ncbi:glycosyltransferase family 2 protein [Mucilaginibacter puniceus]